MMFSHLAVTSFLLQVVGLPGFLNPVETTKALARKCDFQIKINPYIKVTGCLCVCVYRWISLTAEPINKITSLCLLTLRTLINQSIKIQIKCQNL